MAGSRPYRYGRPTSYGRPTGFGRPHDGFGRPVTPGPSPAPPPGGETSSLLGSWSGGVRTLAAGVTNYSSYGMGAFQNVASTPTVGLPLGLAGYVSRVESPALVTNTLSGGANQYRAGVRNITQATDLAVVVAGGATAAATAAGSLAIAATDVGCLAYTSDAGSGSVQLRAVCATYTRTEAGYATFLGVGELSNTSATDTFIKLCGPGGLGYATRALAELRIGFSGTLTALSVYVSIDTRPGSTVLEVLVNGGVAATLDTGSTTGLKTAVLAVALAAGDLICVRVPGAASGSITISAALATIVNSAENVGDLWCADGAAITGTYYVPVIGGTAGVTHRAVLGYNEVTLGFSARLSTPRVYLSIASASPTTATLLVNGVASSVVVTVAAGVTGWFTGSGSVDVGPSDRLSWQQVNSGGTIRARGCRIEYLGP